MTSSTVKGFTEEPVIDMEKLRGTRGRFGYTMVELKAIARSLGLHVTARTKEELAQRILVNYQPLRVSPAIPLQTLERAVEISEAAVVPPVPPPVGIQATYPKVTIPTIVAPAGRIAPIKNLQRVTTVPPAQIVPIAKPAAPTIVPPTIPEVLSPAVQVTQVKKPSALIPTSPVREIQREVTIPETSQPVQTATSPRPTVQARRTVPTETVQLAQGPRPGTIKQIVSPIVRPDNLQTVREQLGELRLPAPVPLEPVPEVVRPTVPQAPVSPTRREIIIPGLPPITRVPTAPRAAVPKVTVSVVTAPKPPLLKVTIPKAALLKATVPPANIPKVTAPSTAVPKAPPELLTIQPKPTEMPPEVVVVKSPPIRGIRVTSPKKTVEEDTPLVAPIPQVEQRTETPEQTHDCVICMEEKVANRDLLRCGHAVCVNCLSMLRKPECPIDRKPLEGSLITDEMYATILLRQEEDRAQEETANYLAAEALAENPDADVYGTVYQQAL